MAPGNRNNSKRAGGSTSTYTIMDFMRDFPDDAACLEYLWRRHYALDTPERAHCPKCGEIRKFHRVASRPSYSCDSCGHHIHPTAGTIMHKSSTSLRLWFYAMYIMASTRCGISAKQLERELGVTYKTAWRMMTQRDAAANMLRTTIAVAAAGLGGADSVSVLPHTLAVGLPDSLARRLARNAQLILLRESNLGFVADPAGGRRCPDGNARRVLHGDPHVPNRAQLRRQRRQEISAKKSSLNQ